MEPWIQLPLWEMDSEVEVKEVLPSRTPGTPAAHSLPLGGFRA